ncbi:MAG TPA: hypothetical protein VG734_00420 [Lacunisphaera sp.]|nr:hypothetical protein [Lacunisphaera sp.]
MNRVLVGIAWFTAEQWPEVQRIMDDKATESFAEWQKNAADLKIRLKKEGVDFTPVPIDLGDFQIWCHRHQRKHDAASRAAYVTEKLRA